MFLSWITAAIKRAVLQGFHEAVEELQLGHCSDTDAAPDPLAALQERMRLAIPAPSSNGDGRKKK